MPLTPRCSQHGSSAGWTCTSCGGALCPECVELPEDMAAGGAVCRQCHAPAEPLPTPGTEYTFTGPLPPRADPADITAAVDANRFDRAMALYRSSPALDNKALAPGVHFRLGKAAADQGDLSTAVRALKAAASVSPDGPVAPAALVTLGRLYAEKLCDENSAQRIWKLVVTRYPGTEAARFAQARVTVHW